MTEYIKKDEVIRCINGLTPVKGTVPVASVIFGVNRIPPSDVVPVRHGKFVDINSSYTGKKKVCSECRGSEYWEKYFVCGHELYCPNCGARMDLGDVDV